jgi:hypothetical protein
LAGPGLPAKRAALWNRRSAAAPRAQQVAARLSELRRELRGDYVYQPTVVVREEKCEEK